jgi:hypothetical protein
LFILNAYIVAVVYCTTQDVPQSWRWIVAGLVLLQLRCEDDLVRKDIYLFTRLQDGHLDVERSYFISQAIAIAFKRPSRGAIHGHARGTNVAVNPAQQDYMAIMLSPKQGKNGLDVVHMAEEDDFELTTD